MTLFTCFRAISLRNLKSVECTQLNIENFN